MSFIFHILKFSLIFLFCLPASAQSLTPEDQAVLNKMSLRRKIGQMFIVGFQGQSLEEGLGDTLKSVAPGGLIVFGRNISSPRQIADLISSAQDSARKVSRVPLFIATDQEGGDVIRIKTPIPLPSPLAFGKAGRPELAEMAGEATGRILKTIGINMNLAPVLDISDPRSKTFNGTRTYGSNPAVVAQMAEKFASGLAKKGVLPTGKHFPGHGGINEDSHTDLVAKPLSLDELTAHDLVPFKELQKRFKDDWAVMLAHLSYPKIDASGAPATFSKPIVTGLLRERMGFNGVVMTDDIGMAGAEQIKDVRERTLRSIEAGVDMIMVTWNRRLQRDLVTAVERAVRSGRIPESRINESVKRILIAKRKFAQPMKAPPTAKALNLALNNRELRTVSAAVLNERFKHELSDDGSAFRTYAEQKPILLFSSNMGFANGFVRALPGRQVRIFKLNVNRPYDINRIMHSNPGAIGVFYMSGYQAGRVAAKISDDIARRMLLITVEAPGHLSNLKSFRYSTAVFLRHPSLGGMIAKRYFVPSPTAIRRPASIIK